jgi:SAM-dependent methyltransferase
MDNLAHTLGPMLERSYERQPTCYLRALEAHLLSGAFTPTQGHVLDIGCAQGFFETLLGQPLERITGIDLARHQLVKRGRRSVQASAQALPFASGAFTIVFSNSVLEHVRGIEETLREAYRVLSDEGALLITVPFNNRAYHKSRAFSFFEKRYMRMHAVTAYLEDSQWQTLFGKAGFKIASVRYYLPYRMAYRVFFWNSLLNLGAGRFRVSVALKKLSLLLSRCGIDFLRPLMDSFGKRLFAPLLGPSGSSGSFGDFHNVLYVLHKKSRREQHRE